MVLQDDAQRRIGGSVAQKYRLLRLLGAGGMGAVYEAEHLFTQRHVALKLMHASIAGSGAAAERFLRESRAPSAIGHPGIVQVLDGGVDDDGSPYVVLELLDGVSLHDAIEGGMLEPEAIVEIGIELLDALQAAHAAGFLHRDIKPENVFLARDARGDTSVRLLDFGIAGVLADDDNPKLTQTGAVLGTPLFMSPEQATGKRADHRSDLWSVGALLYNALAGCPPYTGDSYNALIVSIVTSDPLPLRSRKPELPEALLAVVDRALRKDPAQRFQAAAQMRAALEAVTWSAQPQAGRKRGLPEVPSQRPPATEPQPFAVVSTPRAAKAAATSGTGTRPGVAADGGGNAGAGWWVAAGVLVLSLTVGVFLLRRFQHDARAQADLAHPVRAEPSTVPAALPTADPLAKLATGQPPPTAAAPGKPSGEPQPTAADEPPENAATAGNVDAGKRHAVPDATHTGPAAERDPAALTKVLEEHQSQVQRCLEDAVMAQLQQGDVHAQSYRLSIELAVSPAGRVARSNVDGQAPAELTQCVRKTTEGFVFPAAGQSSVFRFPLVLQPTIVGH